MLAWTATTRHGITRKSTKRLKHKDNLFRKTGLFILDLKPLRSSVKDKHYIGREFQSLAPSELQVDFPREHGNGTSSVSSDEHLS